MRRSEEHPGFRVPLLWGMLLGSSQICATCGYSPPPLPSHGQTADTLGRGGVAVGGELGHGTVASWWDAENLADVDTSRGWVGGGRLRVGIAPDVDLGIASGLGPERTFVVGPEIKWRFSRVTSQDDDDLPGFRAAWISGVGMGSSLMIHDPEQGRHFFIAPYTGLLASAGTRSFQLFSGLRVAASEMLGNEFTDLTLYPTVAFGGELRPWERLAFFAETDFGGALTTDDWGDSGVLVYLTAGMTLYWDR